MKQDCSVVVYRLYFPSHTITTTKLVYFVKDLEDLSIVLYEDLRRFKDFSKDFKDFPRLSQGSQKHQQGVKRFVISWEQRFVRNYLNTLFFCKNQLAVLNISPNQASMFLNLFLNWSQLTGIVLSLFLIFGDFEPRWSYKIVLIKKDCIVFCTTSGFPCLQHRLVNICIICIVWNSYSLCYTFHGMKDILACGNVPVSRI